MRICQTLGPSAAVSACTNPWIDRRRTSSMTYTWSAGELIGRIEAKVLLSRNQSRDDANCRFKGGRSASLTCCL